MKKIAAATGSRMNLKENCKSENIMKSFKKLKKSNISKWKGHFLQKKCKNNQLFNLLEKKILIGQKIIKQRRNAFFKINLTKKRPKTTENDQK